MLTDQAHQKITRFIESLNPELFVVDLRLKLGKKNVLQLKVDTDKGITMSECGKVSRELGPWMDEENILDMEYGLEVSSPGIGEALTLSRQYSKNTGRMLKVVFEEGGEVVGKLGNVAENYIEVFPHKKIRSKDKSRKPEFEETPKEIPWEKIKESKVILKIE